MWLIAGSIPDADFPLTFAPCAWQCGRLRLDGTGVPVNRGTPALLGAACAAADVLGIPMPHALVAGDTGSGSGSRQVYAKLLEILERNAATRMITQITFHYLLPDLDWHNRLLAAIEAMTHRPFLIADAGYMYVAKMSGYAREYDLFTPDIGELAFLADETAPHPFYTRGFLLANEEDAEKLIARAHAHAGDARTMLVKGQIDRVVREGRILYTVSRPDLPALEPIGGTGDTATGLVSALAASGKSTEDAALLALRTNRRMGELADPTPAYGIATLLRFLPDALRDTLR